MTLPINMGDNPTVVLPGCPKSLNRKSLESPGNKERHKRRKVLNEIYETEKTYQHHLMLLTTLFLEPVKVSSILPPRIIDALFSNIEAIQSVSLHLLELMEEHGVVHSLLELAPYMKLYSIYANNFNTSAKLLEELQNRSADFTRLLKFQESREELEQLKLTSLLVTPIQRVPRYRLLLEALLQKTQTDDPNFSKLKEAYEVIASVTSHINECVRQHENFNKMFVIQNSFVGANAPEILLPGRFFLREGPVSKVSSRGNSKERTLFLFNDLLICAKKETSSMYQCCDVFLLANCIVEHVMGSADNGRKEGSLFKVICADKFLLLCAQEEKPRPWPADIKDAISKVHENLSSLKRTSEAADLNNYGTVTVRKKARKPKVTSPTKIFKSKTSNENINSPIFADIENLSSMKRSSTVIEPPAMSIFDIYKNTEDLDLSFNFDVDNYINNNSLSLSLSFNNTTVMVPPDVQEVEEVEEIDEQVNLGYASDSPKENIDWTVTEKNASLENREALASLYDANICCTPKRKQNADDTLPYRKQLKKSAKSKRWSKTDSFSSLVSSDCDKRVPPSPVKQPIGDDSSTSCCIM